MRCYMTTAAVTLSLSTSDTRTLIVSTFTPYLF